MKGKKILVTVIIIVLILILAVGGVAFAYMKTDFLKTDKQLFVKNIAEVRRNIKEF